MVQYSRVYALYIKGALIALITIRVVTLDTPRSEMGCVGRKAQTVSAQLAKYYLDLEFDILHMLKGSYSPLDQIASSLKYVTRV